MAIIFYVLTAAAILFSVLMQTVSGIVVLTHYKLIISGVIIIFAVMGALLAVRAASTPERKKRIVYNTTLLLFLYYVFLIGYMLFFDRNYRGAFILVSSNFVPFKSIMLYFAAWKEHTLTIANVVLNIVGNIFAFVPMGVFFYLLFKPMRNFLIYTLSISICVATVEFVQLITHTGTCDIDDFILNLLGAIIAFGIIKIQITQRLFKTLYIL